MIAILNGAVGYPRHSALYRAGRMCMCTRARSAGNHPYQHTDGFSDHPVIVDTDVGTDDIMALAFLLSYGLYVEAICTVKGMSSVSTGTRNVRKLLGRFDRGNEVIVYPGMSRPLVGSRQFPESWTADDSDMEGDAAEACGDMEKPAWQYLKERFADTSKPCIVLVLGPLTNIALALRENPRPAIAQLICMGGAFTVPGNVPVQLSDGIHRKAEWNVYIDPEAAQEVFSRKDFPQLIVGLDATNKAPIRAKDVCAFESNRDRLSSIGQSILEMLQSDMESIEKGSLYAWDQLAASTIADRSIVAARGANVQVIPSTGGASAGVTEIVSWDEGSNVRVATDTDVEKFHAVFMQAFCADDDSADEQ
jgi:inosine-uridine nucleoside N-ribohydrolase